MIQEQGEPSDSLVFVVSGSLRVSSTLTLRQSHRVPLRHNAWQLTEVQTTRQCLLDRVCASDFCLEEAVLLPGAPCAFFATLPACLCRLILSSCVVLHCIALHVSHRVGERSCARGGAG